MNIDARDYPRGHLLTEVVAEQLGIYVHVAQFVEHEGRKMFRMIVDPEITRDQMKRLTSSSVRDDFDVYTFSHLETLLGPVVDQGPRRVENTSYIRITFM